MKYEVFKSTEALITLLSFLVILVTGVPQFAYIGIVGYVVVNIPGALEKVISLGKWVYNSVTGLFKKGKKQ